MEINLIVVQCKNIEESKDFYELFGLEFKKEKHGEGVEHYAAESNGVVFELYPIKGSENKTVDTMIGFRMPNLDSFMKKNFSVSITWEYEGKRYYEVLDPDDRKVTLFPK